MLHRVAYWGDHLLRPHTPPGATKGGMMSERWYEKEIVPTSVFVNPVVPEA
jgi:hypothetical protein